MKRFNYTGTCIPERHYMADTSNKIDKIIKMIDYGDYFTINRPRQYGKTTTIKLLSEKLKEKYIVIKISFQGKSMAMFETEEAFCTGIISLFLDGVIGLNNEEKEIYTTKIVKDFNELSNTITDIVIKVSKKIILFIDEVDESSNYKIFSKFWEC